MKTLIPYKSSQLKLFLYLGLIWLILGVFQTWLMVNQWWLGLGWIILGLLYLGFYFYRKQKGYVEIDNKSIIKFSLLSKRMYLLEIEKVSYFAEDFILASKSTELRLNKNYMDNDGFELLKKELEDIQKKNGIL